MEADSHVARVNTGMPFLTDGGRHLTLSGAHMMWHIKIRKDSR